MIVLLGFFGIVALVGVAAFWRAYVLSVMWAWFVAPTFVLPTLSLATAYGLSLLIAMLTMHRTGNEAESGESGTQKTANVFAIAFLAPAFVLLAGWITTKFI